MCRQACAGGNRMHTVTSRYEMAFRISDTLWRQSPVRPSKKEITYFLCCHKQSIQILWGKNIIPMRDLWSIAAVKDRISGIAATYAKCYYTILSHRSTLPYEAFYDITFKPRHAEFTFVTWNIYFFHFFNILTLRWSKQLKSFFDEANDAFIVYIIYSAIVADDLVTQEARSSAAMLLAKPFPNVLVWVL